MDANQRIHNDADQLADMYANLESRIFTEIIQVLQQGKRQDVTAENVIEWQAQQLARSGLLVKKVIQIMAEYDQLDPAYIEQVLQQDGYQIVDETTAELEKLGKKAPEVSSNANNLLDSLVNQTRQTLDNTVNQRLLTRNINRNAAVRTYQSILKKSTIETVTGLKKHEQAIKDAIYKQIDEGIPVLKDRAGRTWSLEAYTRMVLTTTANRAYNDARTKRMQEMGQNLCVMTSHPNSRPACAYIQGKVVNIVPDDSPDFNPKYDTIYNHGYGTPAGTLGINCRHVLFPFEEGVNVNHQPQYDPQEAIKNGNLQQRQRAYERSIREAKKRLKAAEDMGDEEAISRYKTLVRARQNRLREFIKETNAGKHNILVRDYSREQISKNILSKKYTSLPMNLQFFGRRDDEIRFRERLNNGEINYSKYKSKEKKFNRAFDKGVDSPIGIIHNSKRKDRFKHITARHLEDFNNDELERTKKILNNPQEIYRTKDKNGVESIMFVENKDDPRSHVVFVRDKRILTSFKPSPGYLKKMKKGEQIDDK
ncbi:phage minor capsid protein [Ligilactobacillus saerimneri]|uniref:phage minor capsid protein n=1 Tax=Ligilactobacillus saerimneri TaxID=228229 RepID=UPI000415A03A|nr:phage minor capsid protein [Ligilactobacillus saerimneri]KRL74542.1 phage minor capsid protein 2 [Ligilactobacillus saerimneri DSM 16049]